MFPDIQVRWVPREENHDADALTHQAYVEYLDAHPAATTKRPLASESQVRTLHDHGIETYQYMGVREANRLLERRLRAIEAREQH